MKRDNDGFSVLGVILLGSLLLSGCDFRAARENSKIQARMDELCANEAGIYAYKTVVVPDA